MSKWNARPTVQLARIEVEPKFTLENVPTPTLIIDEFGRVLHFNHRASVLLERHGASLLGMRVVELLGRDLLVTPDQASPAVFALTLALPSGRRVGVIASTSNISDAVGSSRLMVALSTTRVDGQPWIERVPRIASWSDVAERVAGLDCDSLCVAIGIVGLQSVNESFSRSAGDAVITEIVRRFIAITPVGAVVERITGDRFMIVCSIEGAGDRLVDDIMRVVHESIATRLGEAAVGCAAGVTTGPSRPPLVLLDRADHNLSVALGRGVGTVEWRDLMRPQPVIVSGRLGAPLRAGVKKRAISAHFQPVVELMTGEVVEYEALARWEDDDGASHLAAHFIGVAEDTGVVREVGSQILGSALELWAQMSRVLDRASMPRVSVNVTASELADVTFTDNVNATLAAGSMPANMLQIELTDSVGAEQTEYVQLNMSRLRSTGVRFVLDGFGGHSANLMTLRDFAIDVVKLDSGLVHDALLSTRSLSMLVAILGLAEQIGVEVIAKGIETMVQHELLVSVGCRYAQGFLYSPPLPLAKLEIGARFHLGVALAASF
jgi:EAL domain-containing protein (putative c-di-GMP-specific phosphodiesterase class I)/PAS domain-containing protein